LKKVFSTITSILFHLAANNGLGRHITALHADELDRYFKVSRYLPHVY
jgi:hypothetical protein